MAKPVTPPFDNLYRHGFVRAALAAPRVHLAEPKANAAEIARLAKEAHGQGARLLLTPELALTGYALDDLHLQNTLLDGAEAGLAALAQATAKLDLLIIVGLPARFRGAVYNCAAVLFRGRLVGVVPKTYLPNYREFYERRWFAAGGVRGETISLAGQTASFGVDMVFEAPALSGCMIGVEICEDLWAPIPPSTYAAFAGATLICNLSASNITIGKAGERDTLIAAHSSRAACAYLYAAAGYGESTTDVAWDGQACAFELGANVAHGHRFAPQSTLTCADIDIDRVQQERLRTPTFRDCATPQSFRRITLELSPPTGALPLIRKIDRFPFVPDDPARLDADCYEAVSIQVQGLARRLEASRAKTAIIGVSGGLDSTHALLVTARAFDLLNRPRSDILAFTMPGFATSEGTKANAWALMKSLGVTAAEIDIRPAAQQMLADIGHPFAKGQKVYDVTFENVQAGLRTDYLFRLANHHSGLVVGTGDLSELALGWCTYGVGDHMSHYGVNAGVPKTLIQHLIRWVAASGQVDAETARVLAQILAQEISPELVPADADGKIQSTENTIGPYALHDFALHQIVRCGARPSKIAFLALSAWGDAAKGDWPAHMTARPAYDLATIKKWMAVFLKRFFETSQFKRSALPNGPKVTSAGALSPRGDWRAPSDSSAAVWLEELESNVP
jgi:NAD+ synthase (glutamine-hydrolysing)